MPPALKCWSISKMPLSRVPGERRTPGWASGRSAGICITLNRQHHSFIERTPFDLAESGVSFCWPLDVEKGGHAMDARMIIVLGDIARQQVDAIVNAANTGLWPGAGVCGAIHDAAGPELEQACAALKGCQTGDAKITPGFRLPARWVIHAVGPVWQGGELQEDALLASCYRKSLEL